MKEILQSSRITIELDGNVEWIGVTLKAHDRWRQYEHGAIYSLDELPALILELKSRRSIFNTMTLDAMVGSHFAKLIREATK